MFTKKKPLMFTKTSGRADVENAVDAKQPGDAKEDAQTPPTKKKGKGSAFFANKAAAAFVKK